MFKALVLVYVFDATVSIFLALILGRALLFHFCTHEGRSQHSIADMRVHGSILVTNISGKISPDNANMQRPFFSSNVPFFAEGHPDGVRKYAQMRPKYGNIYPVWTRPKQRFKKKTHPFFPVHLSKVSVIRHTPGSEMMCEGAGSNIRQDKHKTFT